MLWLSLLLLIAADPFDTALRAGLVALNNNNLPAAETQLREAARLQPADARVWLALARTYWKLQRTAEADAAAARAESLTRDPALLQAVAVYYAGAGNTARTAAVVGTAIQHPGLPENYYSDLATVCLRQRDFACSLLALDAGRKAFPQSAQLAVGAGIAYYGLRRFPESIDALLHAIELQPALEQPYAFLGRMLDQAEDRLPRIRAAFAEYARSDPDHYLSALVYGEVLAQDDPTRAEALLRKSIALDPRQAESHFELGILLDSKGRWEEAAAELKRAMELNPGDPVPHFRLARVYDRLHKPAEAKFERDLHARLSAASSQ